MLSYLASALPACASAEARLLAVQCGLRADTYGRLQLRRGLLRSMRLAHSPAPWQELEEARWLRRLPTSPSGRIGRGTHVEVLDGLGHASSRVDRARAADWALRALSRPPVHRRPAAVRLTALALAAHNTPNSPRGCTETDRLTRVCSVSRDALTAALDQLTAIGSTATWLLDPATDDLHWTLPTHDHHS